MLKRKNKPLFEGTEINFGFVPIHSLKNKVPKEFFYINNPWVVFVKKLIKNKNVIKGDLFIEKNFFRKKRQIRFIKKVHETRTLSSEEKMAVMSWLMSKTLKEIPEKV
ncbi:hypothetical protein CSB11_01805 [Candidatus Campbellbacteria bacterium]|nr:MAG: hypothetical protein CSB11_01805 [Candidatus Campbellbacteria bacterium]